MNYRISTDYIQIQLNNTIMCTKQRAGKSQGTGFVKHRPSACTGKMQQSNIAYLTLTNN